MLLTFFTCYELTMPTQKRFEVKKKRGIYIGKSGSLSWRPELGRMSLSRHTQDGLNSSEHLNHYTFGYILSYNVPFFEVLVHSFSQCHIKQPKEVQMLEYQLVQPCLTLVSETQAVHL